MRAELQVADWEDDHASSVEEEFEDFSYIVAHDLATSLRQVAEFSRLLLDEFDEDLTGRRRAYADHVRSAGARCHLMIEQLQVFSRVQQKPLEPERHDATPALRLAVLRLGAEIQAAGAEFDVEPLGEVYADPKLLGLAMRRLLENAIRFQPPGVAPRVAIRSAHDRDRWRMQIIDNGPGVDPALREKAFRMFQTLRADDAAPGVGAGLAISRRIARRHGGDVRFLDCAKGACVELALPHAS